jgi:hypothetical protein
MTSFAFIMGVVPLVVSTGAGGGKACRERLRGWRQSITPRTILLPVNVICPPLERALLNCLPYIRDWIGNERD